MFVAAWGKQPWGGVVDTSFPVIVWTVAFLQGIALGKAIGSKAATSTAPMLPGINTDRLLGGRESFLQKTHQQPHLGG